MDEVESIQEIREKLGEEIPQPEPDKVESPKEEVKEEVKVEEPTKTEEKVEEKPEIAAKSEESTPETPSFTADFKFKVGGKDFEIPEKFRGLITDEATQKEVKEIFEKAYGLDYAKSYHEQTKEKLKTYESEVIPAFKEQNTIINELAGYIQKKDFDSYFERLGIPEKEIQEWMLMKLNLTPEQKALYNHNRELQKQLYQRETENQTLTQSADAAKREAQQEQERQILNQLDFTLGKSEYKDAVQAYESKHGAGSFKNKVIQYAAYVEATEKKSPSIEEAVKGVMEFIPSPVIANQVAPNAQVGGVVIPKDKPVLPQVAAKAQSPAVKQITSIKELRAKAANYGASAE